MNRDDCRTMMTPSSDCAPIWSADWLASLPALNRSAMLAKLSLSDLHKWACDDSPAAYKAHAWLAPVFSPTRFVYTPPTPEEVAKLVIEVVPRC